MLTNPPPRSTSPRARPVAFLYRRAALDEGELDAATAAGFRPIARRVDARSGELVLARLSAWPHPEELDADLTELGAHAVNDARAYRYAASPADWTADLGDLTPRLWTDLSTLPEGVAFVVKGESADKRRWDRMFAPDAAAARRLWMELQHDTGFAGQTLVAREYVPLESLGTGVVTGVPVAVEYRAFYYGEQLLGASFYWPEGDCDRPPPPFEEAIDPAFLAAAAARVAGAGRIPFYTLDVARAADGRCLVIEVSDGQRAGLQGVPPGPLYAALFARLSAGG